MHIVQYFQPFTLILQFDFVQPSAYLFVIHMSFGPQVVFPRIYTFAVDTALAESVIQHIT